MKVVLNGNFIATTNNLLAGNDQSSSLEQMIRSALGAKPGEVIILNVTAEHTNLPSYTKCTAQQGSEKYHYTCDHYIAPKGTCPNSSSHLIPTPTPTPTPAPKPTAEEVPTA